jgi:hypothetical protein
VSLEIDRLEERAYPGQVLDVLLGSALAGTGWVFLDRSLLDPTPAAPWGLSQENGSGGGEHAWPVNGNQADLVRPPDLGRSRAEDNRDGSPGLGAWNALAQDVTQPAPSAGLTAADLDAVGRLAAGLEAPLANPLEPALANSHLSQPPAGATGSSDATGPSVAGVGSPGSSGGTTPAATGGTAAGTQPSSPPDVTFPNAAVAPATPANQASRVRSTPPATGQAASPKVPVAATAPGDNPAPLTPSSTDPSSGGMASTVPAQQTALPAATDAATSPVATPSSARQTLAQVPLSFEANAGQTDPSVQFLSRGPGYTLFVGATDTTLVLNRSQAAPADDPAAAIADVLRLHLAGANPDTRAVGRDLLPGTVNYLKGNDPGAWHTGIATYGRVVLPNVYNGIDLCYYGNPQRQLEYDWTVHPGADPAAIRFDVQGATALALDDQGALHLRTAGGELVEQAPVLYQDGPGGRQSVAGRFTLDGAQLGFQADGYDPGRDLVIDPSFLFSTYLGGTLNDDGLGVATDNYGSVFVTGDTYSMNFPTTAGSYHPGANSPPDAFVAKISASGSLVWSTYLGGAGLDIGRAIAVDAQGNPYVVGDTTSPDFPVTAGAFQTTRAQGSQQDAFITKLNSSGSALVYSSFYGGSANESGYGVALDSSGNAYLTGSTLSTDLPVTTGAYQTTAPAGGGDAFVAKVNSTGSTLLWSTYLGGASGADVGRGIGVAADGTVTVAGYTASTNFPTSSAYQATSAGGNDAFVSKIAGAGPLPPALVPTFGGPGDLLQTVAGAQGGDPQADAFSDAGIRYADGLVEVSADDLSSDGYGMPWGQTRIWTSGAYGARSYVGSGWMDAQLPYLLQAAGSNNTLLAVTGDNARYFDYNGSAYVERYFLADTLAAGTGEFILTDTAGDQWHFWDFSTSLPLVERGMFKSVVDPYGNSTSVSSWTSDGKPQEVQRTTTSGGNTITESYLDSYLTSGVNAGLLSQETLRRQVNGGGWTTVRQVLDSYYGIGDANGNAGDLKQVQVQDGSGNTLDTSYYRYYQPGEANGFAHGLKYVFNPDSYARLAAAVANPQTATDATVAPYADNYYRYDGKQRGSRGDVQGAGASSSTGIGSFTESYTASANAAGYNSWGAKDVETLPDGTTKTVYDNAYGEAMLNVFSSGGLNWENFNKLDGAGRVALAAAPSALTGWNDSYADLLNNQGGSYQYMNSTSGLVTVLDYGTSTTATSSTPGNVLGYAQDTKVQQGQSGTAILQSSEQYIVDTANGITIDPVASTTAYRNTDGTGGETTTYGYTYVTGNPGIQSITTTLPTITTAENGPGSADVSTTYLDSYGRVVWRKDADGFIHYTAYDPATGAVVKTITDVDTTKTGDFTGLPTGWATPAGGGLHLITRMAVDGLGRTRKLTDPLGNVTYTAFNDANYEVRTYPGWNSASGTPTGPTLDSRQDRPGSYSESLSLSAAPHLASAPAAPALAQTSGGTLPATTYYAKVTYLVNGGEPRPARRAAWQWRPTRCCRSVRPRPPPAPRVTTSTCPRPAARRCCKTAPPPSRWARPGPSRRPGW